MAIKFLIKRPTTKKAPEASDLISGEIAIGYPDGNNPALYYKDPLNSDTVKVVGEGYFALTNHNHDGVYQPIDSDLTAIANLTTTGIIIRTGNGTAATRTITAGSTKVTIVNGDGVNGNPTIDINEANININNLGGSPLSVSNGGTGLTSIGSANTILGVNSTGTSLEYKTLNGTANQVVVTNSVGSITLSLPQDIATTSTPTFAQINISSSPTNNNHVATKSYVDDVVSTAIQGLDAKQSVKVATTSNLTYSWSNGVFTVGTSVPTIDGEALSVGDRVLVWQQTSKAQNGIYQLINDSGTYKLVRTSDADTWDELIGAFLVVEKGTYADRMFICKVDTGGTLNTTDIEFVPFGSLATAVAGTALELVGGTLNVKYDSTQGLDVNTNNQLYVKIGDGLTFSDGIITVQAADSSIQVSSSGISLNPAIPGTTSSSFYIGGTSGVYLRNNSGDLSVTDSTGNTYKNAFVGALKLGSGSYWATVSSGTLSADSAYILDVVSGVTNYKLLTDYSVIDGGTY